MHIALTFLDDNFGAEMKRVLLWVFATALAGCATSYNGGRMGFTGGVDAQMITNDTARISARGNGYTDQARISDFVMLKSAETAREHGFTHFIILSGSDASRNEVVSTPGSSQTNVIGNSAYTTYSPGTVQSFHKPGQDVMVKFCSGACSGMLAADEIIANMGPRYYEKQG